MPGMRQSMNTMSYGSRGVVCLDGGDGFLPGRDDIHAGGDGAQGLLEYLARGGVVVHHEHPELREPLGDDLRGAPSRRRPRATP